MTDYRTLVDNRTGRVIASGVDDQYISDLQTAYATLQDRCTALERALETVKADAYNALVLPSQRGGLAESLFTVSHKALSGDEA